MTDYPTDGPTEAVRTSLWEDFVDIFVTPAEVFERRRDGRFGWALAFLTILLTVLSYAFYSALSAAFEADFVREINRAGESADQVSIEALMAFSRTAASFGSIVMVPLGVLLAGIGLWIVARIFGSKLSFLLAVTIATFATFPRVPGIVAGILQGILFDPDSMARVSLGLGRFLDPATTSAQTIALAGRIDLFVLWSVALTAIGLRVIGRLEQTRAWMAAVTLWGVGTLFVLLPVLMGSAASL